MLGLFLFLTLPPTAALLLGLGVGWLGRWIPGGRFWCLAWGVGALLLPAASLRGYMEATAQAAALAPQRAAVWSAFQVGSLLLFALVAGLTLWGAWRAARWTPAPLLALFPIFYGLVLPPIFAAMPDTATEWLATQLDGDVNRGFFLACLCGAALLTGLVLTGHRPSDPQTLRPLDP